MRLVLTAAVFLGGLLNLFMAISFLTDPQQAARSLGVLSAGAAGVSTIRADFTAFFGVAGLCMMWGAWRRNADLLIVPALLFGASFAVRLLDLGLSGSYPGWAMPMTYEALHVLLMMAAWRMLPHHKLAEIAT